MSTIFNEAAFNEYRARYPEQRFFQALRNYLEVDRIEVVYKEDEEMQREDTFYWYDEKQSCA